MNCDRTRELFSDWLDEALDARQRAEVEGHLDGCQECRREVDRLRATVSLLSRVERPRAPVGFVDRVLAAARPGPWHRRLARRLFLPLTIKRPVQAAAMLVIAVLGVYLLQRTPELRDAARLEREAPAYRSTAPAAPPAEPAPAQQALKPGVVLRHEKVDRGNVSEPAPRAAREAENTVRAERRLDAAQSPPPATQDYKQEPKKEADADRLRKAGAPTSQTVPAGPAAPALQSAAPAASPPAETFAESRAKSRDSAEGSATLPGPAPPAAAAKRQSAVSGVVGRLEVKDRPAAERGLADLLARLGGSETGRRQELGATVVEVLVPEARYTDFVRGLTTLGAWTPEGQPTALPTDPPQVRLSVRIVE